MIFDFDQHLLEYPTMWQEHCDPQLRHLALETERDSLGYPWVISRALGRRVYILSKTVPEDGFVTQYEPWKRWKAGLPAEVDYLEDLPADAWEPKARVATLDRMGLDRALLFPNVGFLFGRMAGRLDIMRANLGAWNRWAVTVRQEGQGRLEPVGHVTLRGGDLTWLEEQLRYLSTNGIRAALLSYGLVDGRRMSHPDHDRAWKAFVDNGIVPVFHIQDSDVRASGLPEGWFEDDPDPLFGALDFVFSHLGVQVAVADLILGGVFDRFPALKFATVELTAGWIGPLVAGATGIPGSVGGVVNGPGLDISYGFEAMVRENKVPLRKPPSQYLFDHFRVTCNPNEPVAHYFNNGLADMLMFGGDYPHCEGFADPIKTFNERVGPLSEEHTAKLYGGTAAALLGIA
jgi:predicted TIM-barrel fold metal-dependent hydrolase